MGVMIRHIISAMAAVSMLCAASAASPQSAAPPDGFPFSVWIERKEVTQIPWTFWVGRPQLRTDFRQELTLRAAVQSRELQQGDEAPDLVLYARVLENGRAISPIRKVLLRDQLLRPETERVIQPGNTPARWHSLALSAIVQPGKYKLEVALLDRGTGRYSTRYESVTVSGGSKSLIERSFAESSKFEFPEIPKPEKRETSPLISPEIFGGGIAGQIIRRGPFDFLLRLPIEAADRPVSSASRRFVIDRQAGLRLSVFSVLSPPESALEDENARYVFQSNLMNILSALTLFDVARGSADLIALDLGDRSRAFDRVSLRDVQKDSLRSVLAKDRSVVSLQDLVSRPDSGKFLRDALEERLREAETDISGAIHAIIIAGARSVAPGSRELTPIPAADKCHCKVFYIRFSLAPTGSSSRPAWTEKDDMPRLLSAYKPRVFEPLTWAGFRDQFAAIYEELAQ
jgi:hypothetical protein